MDKICKHCKELITDINAAKKNGARRNECKACRVKINIRYKRLTLEQKQVDCEVCNKKCIKKFFRAFCSDICRFMGFVNQDKDSGCWFWKGSIKQDGYGSIMIKSKNIRAHRYSYELFKQPIEPGNLILHSCHTPKCVNPKHLRQGTPKENTQDMLLANRWNGGRPAR